MINEYICIRSAHAPEACEQQVNERKIFTLPLVGWHVTQEKLYGNFRGWRPEENLAWRAKPDSYRRLTHKLLPWKP
jgi:hypothetical protein